VPNCRTKIFAAKFIQNDLSGIKYQLATEVSDTSVQSTGKKKQRKVLSYVSARGLPNTGILKKVITLIIVIVIIVIIIGRFNVV